MITFGPAPIQRTALEANPNLNSNPNPNPNPNPNWRYTGHDDRIQKRNEHYRRRCGPGDVAKVREIVAHLLITKHGTKAQGASSRADSSRLGDLSKSASS